LIVQEIIQLYAGIYGKNQPVEMIDLFSTMQLQNVATKRFGQLSGGQQQRISLQIALINNKNWVLLDEPPAARSQSRSNQLWERIEAMERAMEYFNVVEDQKSLCRIAIIDHDANHDD
jgi:ABC-2 type transport system ATP-binding protein